MSWMGSGDACPTHPAWRGVSQAEINFSKGWGMHAAMQQWAVCDGWALVGLGFVGGMGL
jgi:hypothetical protein